MRRFTLFDNIYLTQATDSGGARTPNFGQYHVRTVTVVGFVICEAFPCSVEILENRSWKPGPTKIVQRHIRTDTDKRLT